MKARWCELAISIFLLQLLLLMLRVKAEIKCICTTSACQQNDVVTCTARAHCYVQYFAKTVDDVGLGVIRGCIDGTQPLLCDNKRPTTIKDEWPVLHCCQDEYCNRDVIPTAPPWLVKATAELRRNKSRELSATDAKISQTTLEYARQSKYEHQNNEELLSINPIFIGVPIAGACVLLAIGLFAIFLLRRNNQRHFRRNYNLATNQKSALQSADKLCNHSNGVNIFAATKPQQQQQQTYDVEHGSGKSESKLLMRV